MGHCKSSQSRSLLVATKLANAGRRCDSFGEIAENVADRDDAGQFALEKNRDVAVATDVHFVEGVGDFFLGLECDRVWGHELRDRASEELFGVDVNLHECVALAEDA